MINDGADESGTIPYLIVYFAGGIYGFVLGGNFGRVGVPSAGASGALFAIVSCSTSGAARFLPLIVSGAGR